jgi:hypothetical protein
MGRLLRSTQTSVIGDNYTTTTVENSDEWIIAIEKADYVEGYILRLIFSDGHEQLVDFEPFLRKSHNPHIRQYLDQKLFQEFTLAGGDLFWHDYDLCFPIADLYKGQV